MFFSIERSLMSVCDRKICEFPFSSNQSATFSLFFAPLSFFLTKNDGKFPFFQKKNEHFATLCMFLMEKTHIIIPNAKSNTANFNKRKKQLSKKKKKRKTENEKKSGRRIQPPINFFYICSLFVNLSIYCIFVRLSDLCASLIFHVILYRGLYNYCVTY